MPGVRDRYDMILLDCCPSLGMLTINALAAADEIIIPSQAHYLSLRGMEQLTIIMVDSNLQREKILPGEKAFAYRMKLCHPLYALVPACACTPVRGPYVRRSVFPLSVIIIA